MSQNFLTKKKKQKYFDFLLQFGVFLQIFNFLEHLVALKAGARVS